MNRLRLILGLALLAGCIGLVVELVFTLRAARTAIEQARSAVAEARVRLVHTSQNANGVLIQLGLAADQWAGASREQRIYWRRTAAETEATIRELRLAAERIQQELLPQLAAALESSDRRMERLTGEAAGSLRETTENLQPVLENLARAAAGAAERMNDPALAETMAQTRLAAERLAAAGENVEHGTGELAAAAEDVRRQVRRGARLSLWLFLVRLAAAIW